jgi:hypothetical protein
VKPQVGISALIVVSSGGGGGGVMPLVGIFPANTVLESTQVKAKAKTIRLIVFLLWV